MLFYKTYGVVVDVVNGMEVPQGAEQSHNTTTHRAFISTKATQTATSGPMFYQSENVDGLSTLELSRICVTAVTGVGAIIIGVVICIRRRNRRGRHQVPQADLAEVIAENSIDHYH